MKPPLKTMLKWGAGILLLIVFAGLFFPCLGCQSNPARRLNAKNQMQAIDNACRCYLADYGSYPVGTASEIASTLLGKNPRGIIFLEVRAKDRNPAGEVVDPWQTPFRFEGVSAAEPARLSSAGPDQIFGTQDDIRLP